ncbi:MAG: hypothetical protein HY765_00260 [Rhodomicrobium sp.]|nr:hypothetical protein [Rhodomicrobium sp.]
MTGGNGTKRAGAKEAIAALAVFGLVVGAGLIAAWYLSFARAGPSPALYASRIGPAGQVIPAGELVFDGVHFTCGRHPTVFNPGFSGYGAAFFGFILLNPGRFALLPLGVKRFAYAHECGHQYVGYSEIDADCYAVKRGQRDGWLDPASLEEVCAFFSRSKGTALHLPGLQRCAAIRLCYRKNSAVH